MGKHSIIVVHLRLDAYGDVKREPLVSSDYYFLAKDREHWDPHGGVCLGYLAFFIDTTRQNVHSSSQLPFGTDIADNYRQLSCSRFNIGDQLKL